VKCAKEETNRDRIDGEEEPERRRRRRGRETAAKEKGREVDENSGRTRAAEQAKSNLSFNQSFLHVAGRTQIRPISRVSVGTEAQIGSRDGPFLTRRDETGEGSTQSGSDEVSPAVQCRRCQRRGPVIRSRSGLSCWLPASSIPRRCVLFAGSTPLGTGTGWSGVIRCRCGHRLRV
jgi:hypothetical protein